MRITVLLIIAYGLRMTAAVLRGWAGSFHACKSDSPSPPARPPEPLKLDLASCPYCGGLHSPHGRCNGCGAPALGVT
jgi:hypothetical protein